MATYTSYLNLKKPEGGERYALADFNANMQKIDDFVGTTKEVYITNEYSTILSAINAFRETKTFPFTIQKAGGSAISDLPSGLSNTCEWNVVCSGNSQRITAILTVFTGGSVQNGFSWTANIYNGAYVLNWTSFNSQRTPSLTSSNVTSDTSIISLAPGAYQVADNNMNTDYIPGKWGTLIVNRSAVTYAAFMFIDTSGNVFVRHANGTSNWHGAWQKLALNSQLEPSGYSSATRSDTFLSSGSCYYVQIGKIILVHVTDMTVSSAVPSASATYANAFFTGLPKAKITGRLFTLNQFSTSKAMRVSVANGTNDAAIASHYDGVSASGNQFYGTFWYIAA